jgi:hypothetical protein
MRALQQRENDDDDDDDDDDDNGDADAAHDVVGRHGNAHACSTGESRVIEDARERQKEFEASAYAHRQRMILDLQVTAVVVGAMVVVI